MTTGECRTSPLEIAVVAALPHQQGNQVRPAQEHAGRPWGHAVEHCDRWSQPPTPTMTFSSPKGQDVTLLLCLRVELPEGEREARHRLACRAT
jgi:hypothetical protein